MREEAMTARDFYAEWKKSKPLPQRPTLDELETILNSGDTREVTINPDGSIGVDPPSETIAFAEAYHAYRTRCELKDAREGLGAITEALKEPAGGSWHPLREFCNKRGIYNEDIADERVLRRVAAFILESLPAPEERK